MIWIIEDWHKLLGKPWAEVALALISVLCGALIGFERERKDKPTGVRTLTLVCLGSAVFTLVSDSDHRIAAQIVTGIGFLGAGAVIHGRFGVSGLTSAAAIWAVAAVGMVIGTGYAGGGFALSMLILAVLTIISAFEQKFLGPCKYAVMKITMQTNGGKTLIMLEETLNEFHVHAKDCIILKATDETTEMSVRYCQAHAHHKAFLTQVAEMPEVCTMEREAIAHPAKTLT